MRKSNFFHFIIHLTDENQTPIEVERAVFKDFHDSYTVSRHAASTRDIALLIHVRAHAWYCIVISQL